MKNQLTALLLVFVLVLTMAGCSAANAAHAPESRTQVAAFPTASGMPAEAPPAATESSRELTGEQAQQIALEHLRFTADQVSRLRTEYEVDDGIPQFDVEFYQGDWEYEFEIHAETGEILSFDKDHKYD